VVEIDKDTFSKFFDAVITNDVSTATSGEGFDLTLFANVPCTLSSFRRATSANTTWQFISTCVENDSISVSGWINKSTHAFAVTLNLENGTQQNLVTIDEKFASLYEFIIV
jgi:hypothetical protein